MRGVHLYPESDEELVKVDGPTPVVVKLLEEFQGLWFVDHDAVVIQTLQELLQVQGTALVIIHYLEGPEDQNMMASGDTYYMQSTSTGFFFKLKMDRLSPLKGSYCYTCFIGAYNFFSRL